MPYQSTHEFESTPYSTAFDYDASNNPIYIGTAPQGSAKSATVWQIRKLTYDASNNVTDVQYAGGSTAHNLVWNSRASYSYT